MTALIRQSGIEGTQYRKNFCSRCSFLCRERKPQSCGISSRFHQMYFWHLLSLKIGQCYIVSNGVSSPLRHLVRPVILPLLDVDCCHSRSNALLSSIPSPVKSSQSQKTPQTRTSSKATCHHSRRRISILNGGSLRSTPSQFKSILWAMRATTPVSVLSE